MDVAPPFQKMICWLVQRGNLNLYFWDSLITTNKCSGADRSSLQNIHECHHLMNDYPHEVYQRAGKESTTKHLKILIFYWAASFLRFLITNSLTNLHCFSAIDDNMFFFTINSSTLLGLTDCTNQKQGFRCYTIIEKSREMTILTKQEILT